MIVSSDRIYPSPVPELSFLPTPLGAEPGRAKEESRITCMRMLRTTPFFSPKSGGKAIFGSTFQIWLVARFSEWQHSSNNFCIQKSVEFHQCHANPHSICFLSQYQRERKKSFPRFVDNWKHRLGLESARAALCKWATCTRQTFLKKTFAKSLNIQKQYEKDVWEKSNDAYSLSTRVQSTINHRFRLLRFYVFYDNINVKENVFFQSARWKRHCATHWRERRGWDLVIFYWFALSMRMQVILDSSFARPGWAPI